MSGFLAAVAVLLPFAEPDLSYPWPDGVDFRLAKPTELHGPGCRAAIYSRDGSKLATMSDRSVLVRSRPGGRRLFELHFPRITSTHGLLAFSPDGRFVVAGETGLSRLSVGDLKTGEDWRLEPEQSSRQRFDLQHVAFVSNGLLRVVGEVLTETHEKTGRFEAVDFDPEQEKPIARRELPGELVRLAVDGSAAILKFEDELRRFDLTVWRVTGKGVKLADRATLRAVEAGCRRVVVADGERHVGVVDIVTGKTLRKMELPAEVLPGDQTASTPRKQEAFWIGLSDDGTELTAVQVSGNIPQPLRRWRISDGKELPPLDGFAGPVVVGIQFRTDTITLQDANGFTSVWNRATGVRIGPPTRPLQVVMSANGRWIATQDGVRFVVREASSGVVVHSVRRAITLEGTFGISDDGNRVVFCAGERLCVLDLVTKKDVFQQEVPFAASCRFMPSGVGVLVSNVRNQELTYWNTTLKAEIWSRTVGANRSTFLGDKRVLIVSDDDCQMIEVNTETGKELRTGEIPACHPENEWGRPIQIATSANGRTVAVVRPTHVDLFNAKLQHLRRIQVIPLRDRLTQQLWSDIEQRVTGVVVSPDGQRIALGLYSAVRGMATGTEYFLYEVATGELVKRLDYEGYSARTPLGFTPSGRHLWTFRDGVALRHDLRPQAMPVFDRKNIVAEWRGSNASLADLAAGRLAAPGMLKWIGQQLPRDPTPDAARVAELIGKLSDRDFQVREQATSALLAMGAGVSSYLQPALKANPSAESRQRIQMVLGRLSGEESPEVLLRVRAVAAVAMWAEDTPAARGLLEAWAKGDGGSPLTTTAQDALRRLPK